MLGVLNLLRGQRQMFNIGDLIRMSESPEELDRAEEAEYWERSYQRLPCVGKWCYGFIKKIHTYEGNEHQLIIVHLMDGQVRQVANVGQDNKYFQLVSRAK